MGRGIDIVERGCEDKGFFLIWESGVVGSAGAEQSSTTTRVFVFVVEVRSSRTETKQRRVEET